MGWRMLRHLGALLAFLMAVAWWTGASGRVSVDEGAAAIQAQALADHGDWTIDDPMRTVDPTGRSFGLRHTETTPEGHVALAKHPLYPVLLAALDRLGGVRLMVGLSIVGTVVAAGWSACLSRRLRPGIELATLYGVGLASPLLFDSSLLIAHSGGAAAAAGAAVAFVRFHESTGPRARWWLVPAAGGLMFTVLLRGEGLLLVLAGAVVAVAAAALRSGVRWWLTAGTMGASGLAAVAIDRGWHAAIVQEGRSVLVPATAESFLADRLEGLHTITLKASYAGGTSDRLLWVAVGVLALAALLLRVAPAMERVALIGTALAAAVLCSWLLVAGDHFIPGIAIAFPALWFGLGQLRGADLGAPLVQVLLATSLLFALAVVATQYRQGGGLEWGARYLAIAVPLAVPVAALGFASAFDRLEPERARVIGGSVLVVTAVLGVASARSRAETDRASRQVESAIVALAEPSSLGPLDDDRRPIVVSTEFAVPQALWHIYADHRWVRLRDDEPLPTGPDPRVARLVDLGVDRFTLVTRDAGGARALLGDGVVVSEDLSGLAAWDVVTVTVPTNGRPQNGAEA